jgi:hypothetical protein
MLHDMNSTHTAHAATTNATVPDSEQPQMSQRYARVPFLLCKFHAHACSNPGRLCQRYALCSTFYVYFTWLRQQLQKALACCGLGLAAV